MGIPHIEPPDAPSRRGAKIKAHAEYVCWRDGKVVPPSNRGQGRRKNQISGPKSDLPTAWWW